MNQISKICLFYLLISSSLRYLFLTSSTYNYPCIIFVWFSTIVPGSAAAYNPRVCSAANAIRRFIICMLSARGAVLEPAVRACSLIPPPPNQKAPTILYYIYDDYAKKLLFFLVLFSRTVSTMWKKLEYITDFRYLQVFIISFQKCLTVSLDDFVWDVKRKLLATLPQVIVIRSIIIRGGVCNDFIQLLSMMSLLNVPSLNLQYLITRVSVSSLCRRRSITVSFCRRAMAARANFS